MAEVELEGWAAAVVVVGAEQKVQEVEAAWGAAWEMPLVASLEGKALWEVVRRVEDLKEVAQMEGGL